MLDKNIPYYNVILARHKGTEFPSFSLPEGYKIKTYTGGDEKSWAEIETSVGEFKSISESKAYFTKEYLPFSSELQERLFFVENDKNEKIATAMAWWSFIGDMKIPSLHWIAVKPQFQGLGIGKAVTYTALKRSIQLEGDVKNYIHTQTWSYKAIGIYISLGFLILRNGSFWTFKNDYKKAIPYLKEKMGHKYDPEKYAIH